MKKIITLLMCLICCCSYAFLYEGNGGSGWIAEPTSIIISGGGSGGGGEEWEPIDPDATYYSVTLYDDDRTTILYEPKKIIEGGSISLSNVIPSKDNATFTSWTDEDGQPITSVDNITSNVRVYAMWNGGRRSITYYLDGEYQGTQLYSVGETIVPLAAPEPYNAEVDSCFVGWYNIPQDFKMPDRNIIATATIDESYYINFNWTFDGGASGGNSHAYRGYIPYYSVLSVVNGEYNNTYKIPPVHNSRVVESAYFLIPSTVSSYFINNNIPMPTEMYIGGDNITKELYLGSNQFSETLYTKIGSLTVYLPNVASEPYVDNGVTVNPSILLRSMFSNANTMKYVDLSVFNVNTLGGMAGSTMIAGCEIRSSILETYKLPETIQTYYGRMVNYCRDPIYIPDVATFTWIYDSSSNGMLKPNGLNYVVASDTRFIFKSKANARNSYFINQGQNISFTFEGGYLPVNDVNSSYTPFANGSTITIYYHGNCGEWADPSFKTDTLLWGTLSQYTWVDLDAEPAPIEPIVTATYIDGLDASHTVSIATGTDNSINLGLDYVYEIKAKYTGANITALDTTTRWTSSDITVLSEELIDNETVCARIKLSDAYFANADQPHAQTLSFDNSGITSESPLATFSFSIIPQNFYSYNASDLSFAVQKYNGQRYMGAPVSGGTLNFTSYQDRAYVVFALGTTFTKSNSDLPNVVFYNQAGTLEELGHFAGTREEWEDIWSNFTLYWGNSAGAATKSYRANDFVAYKRLLGSSDYLPPMFNIDFDGIGASNGYYTIFYTGSVLKKDVLKHLRTGNEYVLAYYNADTPISAQPAISIRLY